MTRECKADFKKLEDYISNYSISENLDKESYVMSARKMHKIYFSLMNWHAEYKEQKDFFSSEYSDNPEIILRLSESVSDIGSSQFNWLNGSYKTSRVMLRSAIENFIRSVSAIEDNSQLTEKSVYKVFDKANNITIFKSSDTINKAYQNLHSKYIELCKDTHTASLSNMEQITSLADYPKYMEEKSNLTREIFIVVVKDMLIILCLCFNGLYHKIHHRNKDNILNSLPKSCKSLINSSIVLK